MKSTNPYRNNYEAIRYMSKMIDGYFEGYGFTNQSKKDLAQNPDQFAWKSHDYPHVVQRLGMAINCSSEYESCVGSIVRWTHPRPPYKNPRKHRSLTH
jgi:hypothetical protein